VKKRFGQVIRLKPEGVEEYVKLHQKVWPGVKAMISAGQLQNYSIYLKDNLLSAYLE
jgi:L-rhamnose mutarotase